MIEQQLFSYLEIKLSENKLLERFNIGKREINKYNDFYYFHLIYHKNKNWQRSKVKDGN